MLFQEDYWAMDGKELEKRALKFHIAAGTQGGYDRKYAIECLLARDQAMRTSLTVVATIVSVGSAIMNILLLIAARVG